MTTCHVLVAVLVAIGCTSREPTATNERRAIEVGGGETAASERAVAERGHVAPTRVLAPLGGSRHEGLRLSPLTLGKFKRLSQIWSYSDGRLAVTWTAHETGRDRAHHDQAPPPKPPRGRPWTWPVGGKPGDEYWGFVDVNGEVVVQPRYYDANFYYEGLAAVNAGPPDDPRWGMIDVDGNVVIPFEHDWIGYMSEGLAAFAEGRKFGYLDRNGKVVIRPRFQDAYPFRDGRAVVTYRNVDADFPDRRVIDREGRILRRSDRKLDPLFEWRASLADQGMPIPFEHERWNWGYRTADGVIVIAPQYQMASVFTEGLAAVDIRRGDGKGEYIDLIGKVQFSLPYDGTDIVSDGRIVRWESMDNRPFKWGVYDTKGNLVFDEITGYELPPRHVSIVEGNEDWRADPE